MTRVYAPADLDLLRAWFDAGVVGGGPERVVAGDDDEESEAAALIEAAADSAALGASTSERRRVVVVAETTGDPDADVPWRDVVAVHADLAPAAPGRADQRADPSDDLPPWVATQEVARLLDGTL